MKLLQITNAPPALVDDDIYEKARWYKWQRRSGKIARGIQGYPYSAKLRITLHNFVMDGPKPNLTVDHKDCNPFNNQRDNLRWATRRLQAMNHGKFFKGVELTKLGFRAVVKVEGKRIESEEFSLAEDAARAYDNLALDAYGSAATLNFPWEHLDLETPKPSPLPFQYLED